MAKEIFSHPETARVLELIDEAARRSGVSRGQAFEDYLHMAVCALSGGQLEEQYLETVKKHAAGEQGNRGCDSLADAFGELVAIMEETRADILGDLFQGAITYGEAGQFMTPEPVCQLMARTLIDAEDRGEQKTVVDPCCGSGRMLLAAAEVQPWWGFIGQDIDLRCVRMTAINLALRNRYGFVIWGDSLALEQRLVYRTGFDDVGFVCQVPLEECPQSVQQVAAGETFAEPKTEPPPDGGEAGPPKNQLRLF